MTSQTKTHHHNNSHVPVLLEATLAVLSPKPGETYLDLTAGYGGHAKAMLSNLGDARNLTCVDQDEQAIAALKTLQNSGARVLHSDFYSAAKAMLKRGEQFDIILMDLGVSSPHLDTAIRGFSFKHEGPLDMRMDQRQKLTATDLIEQVSESELADILWHYGEEPKSKKIARAIKQVWPLSTTTELAAVVEQTIGRRGKIHPATRTFQALRIALNDELGQLERTLPLIPDLLRPGGRVGVISFHSLEDRLVKQFLASESKSGYESRLKLLTKKPISGATEDVLNRRSRSAKLRAAVKINT